METNQLQRRIAGRKMAQQLYELIDGPVTDFNYIEALLDELTKLAGYHKNEPQVVSEPISRLGLTVMPFGEFKGNNFDEVSMEYLDWLCSAQERFLRQLQAYLKHPQLEDHRRQHSMVDANSR